MHFHVRCYSTLADNQTEKIEVAENIVVRGRLLWEKGAAAQWAVIYIAMYLLFLFLCIVFLLFSSLILCAGFALIFKSVLFELNAKVKG